MHDDFRSYTLRFVDNSGNAQSHIGVRLFPAGTTALTDDNAIDGGQTDAGGYFRTPRIPGGMLYAFTTTGVVPSGNVFIPVGLEGVISISPSNAQGSYPGASGGGSAPVFEIFEPFEVMGLTAIANAGGAGFQGFGGGSLLSDFTSSAISFAPGGTVDGAAATKLSVALPAVPSGYDCWLVKLDASLVNVKVAAANDGVNFSIYTDDVTIYEAPFVDVPIALTTFAATVCARLVGLMRPKATLAWWYGANKAEIASALQGSLQVAGTVHVRPYKLVNGQAF